MNHFERVAIFTLVENIESQLRGLKTLLAASSNQGSPAREHKVTQTTDIDSHELSDDEEAILQKTLEEARQAEIDRMRKAAENHFQKEWSLAAEGMAKLDDASLNG